MKVNFAFVLLVSSVAAYKQVLGVRFLNEKRSVEVANSEAMDMNWTLKSLAESEQQLKLKYKGDEASKKEEEPVEYTLKNAIYQDEEEVERSMTAESEKEAAAEKKVQDAIDAKNKIEREKAQADQIRKAAQTLAEINL